MFPPQYFHGGGGGGGRLPPCPPRIDAFVSDVLIHENVI